MLPDAQAARQIAGRGLSVWIRYKIATGELDKAEEAIRVGFGVNRHFGRTPFVVTKLITVALNNLLLQRLEELIAQPGSANYYWALTALPRPLVDVSPRWSWNATTRCKRSKSCVGLMSRATADQWADLDRLTFQLYFNLGYNNTKPPTEDERNWLISGPWS